MDTYVRFYNDRKTGPDDNPTIGLVLYSEKSQAVVRYSGGLIKYLKVVSVNE